MNIQMPRNAGAPEKRQTNGARIHVQARITQNSEKIPVLSKIQSPTVRMVGCVGRGGWQLVVDGGSLGPHTTGKTDEKL